MNEISRIQAALRPHLPWHGARLTFLALFLIALFRVETVNLDKLASVFANRAQSESNHKRLTRFFRGFDIDLTPGCPGNGNLESSPAAMDPESRPHELVIRCHPFQHLDAGHGP